MFTSRSNIGQVTEICQVKLGWGEPKLGAHTMHWPFCICYSSFYYIQPVISSKTKAAKEELLEKEGHIQKMYPRTEITASLTEISTHLEASWPRLSRRYVGLIVNFQFWSQCNNCFNHQWNYIWPNLFDISSSGRQSAQNAWKSPLAASVCIVRMDEVPTMDI